MHRLAVVPFLLGLTCAPTFAGGTRPAKPSEARDLYACMADDLRTRLHVSDWITIDFATAPPAKPDPKDDLDILKADPVANPSFVRAGAPMRCGTRPDLSLAAATAPILHDPLQRRGSLATYSYDTCHVSWPNTRGRRLAITYMCFTTRHQALGTNPDGQACGGDQRWEAFINSKIFRRTEGRWREVGEVETGNAILRNERPLCRNAVP